MSSRVSHCAAVVATCLAGAAWAEPPNGSYALAIGGANEIWTLEGEYADCGGDSEVSGCVNTNVSTSPSGAVTGTGSFEIHGIVEGDLAMSVAGQMSGRASDPRAKLTIAFAGSVTVEVEPGVFLPADATGAFKVTCRNPMPHADRFTCRGRIKLCVAALGRRKCSSGSIETLLHAEGGPWHAFLDLGTDPANAVTGTASAELAHGVPGQYAGVGKYDPKKDRAKLKLVSTDPGSKDKLTFSNVVTSGDSVVGGTLKFKVAGQTGTEKILPPP